MASPSQLHFERQHNPYAGLIPAATAILLLIVDFRVPRISEDWWYVHLTLRVVMLVMATIAVFKIGRTLNRVFPVRTWLGMTHQRMTIPLEGWIYLGIMFVLFIGAMMTNQNTLMLVFAFMAGPFVINGWMTFGMLQSVRIQRHLPARAMQGELFSVELTLNNARPLFSLWMISVEDEIRHPVEGLSASILFSRVSPRSSLTGQYDLALAHRGRYRFGPLRVTSRFPLGLIERTRVFPTGSEILIYPRIGKISPYWRHKLDNSTELVSRPQPHRGIYNDDFHRLREFRAGDNPRAIHWRSTARRGELILREYQQNRDHVLAIVLDLFQPPMRIVTSEIVENALSFVASLLVDRGHDCHDGILTLAAAGRRSFRWEGQGHAGSLEQLFDGLALFDPGPADEARDLLNDVIQHCTSTTQIVVVTTRTSELPYSDLLNHRVDLLNLSEVSIEELLLLDDVDASRVDDAVMTPLAME